MKKKYDVIIVGAGTAGIPVAIFSAKRGANVLLVEKQNKIGGTLFFSAGQMSAAGSKLQKIKNINDNPSLHYKDAMRISKGTSDPELLKLATNEAASTIDWLMEENFEMAEECPKIFYGHEAYNIARTYWGKEGGLSILKVFEKAISKYIKNKKIDLKLNYELINLIKNSKESKIIGIETKDNSKKIHEFFGTNIVLTTGGYGSNKELFKSLNNNLLFSSTPLHADGKGILLAESIGATIRNKDKFLPTFAGIAEKNDPMRVDFWRIPNLTPQLRPPWEIYVNLEGKRFMAEDNPSVDKREKILIKQKEMTFWIIFDEKIYNSAPPILGKQIFLNRPGWTKGEVLFAFDNHPSFKKANNPEELATLCKINKTNLINTIKDYNLSVLNKNDKYGRKHLPLGIYEPPYRAIKVHGFVLKTPAGLSVNKNLEIVNSSKKPIKNVYAAGEAIGGGTLSGLSFVGGMSVTPAISFGKLLGEKILKW